MFSGFVFAGDVFQRSGCGTESYLPPLVGEAAESEAEGEDV